MRSFALLMALTGTVLPQSLVQRAAELAPRRSNPYQGSAKARLAGAKLFGQNCEPCHGKEGHGNGRRGTPPVASPMVRHADPGALFWTITNGSPSHRMPSFGHLPEQQRWQIITYLNGLDQ